MKLKAEARLIVNIVIGGIVFILLLLLYKNLLYQMSHGVPEARPVNLPAYIILAVCDLLFKTAFIFVVVKGILPSFTREKRVAKLFVLFVAVLLLFFVSEVLTKGWLLPGFHFMHLWGHIPIAFQHIGILSLEFHVDKLSRPLL